MPASIPSCPEVGATSAPLLSASYFIGARCAPYNDDYMLCKQESNGRGELECLREGRRVTRCAVSVLDDMNKNCLVQFKTHWECLERGNQELWQCRGEEQALNKCVFQKLGMEKKIPDASGEEPVHLKKKPIYKPYFPSTVEQVERKQAEHGA